MIQYKIIDSRTSLFSRGGEEPRFDKVGKVWNTLAHVKSHIKVYEYKGVSLKQRDFPEHWLIVKYTYSLFQIETIEVKDIRG